MWFLRTEGRMLVLEMKNYDETSIGMMCEHKCTIEVYYFVSFDGILAQRHRHDFQRIKCIFLLLVGCQKGTNAIHICKCDRT